MGDIADWLIEQEIDNGTWFRLEHYPPSPHARERVAATRHDAVYYQTGPYTTRRVTCKYCKKGDLRWNQVDGLWHLVDNETGNKHHCRRANIKCKYCGIESLVWDNPGTGWVLKTVDGSPHVCPARPPPFINVRGIVNDNNG